MQNKIGHMRNLWPHDQAKEKAKVYAYILVYAYNIVQELIKTKKRGRACNLNWAEFLNCTKNRTSSQE